MSRQEMAELLPGNFNPTAKLNRLLRESGPQEVPDCTFTDSRGEAALRELFGEREQLLAIRNLGQACRHCTLRANGFNRVLPRLEDAIAVVPVPKDPPGVQWSFASSRGWRLRPASRGGGPTSASGS